MHDLVRGTCLTEAGRGRGAVGGLAEYRRPGRESGIRRAEVRGAQPDEIDPARRSGRDPGEEVRPLSWLIFTGRAHEFPLSLERVNQMSLTPAAIRLSVKTE